MLFVSSLKTIPSLHLSLTIKYKSSLTGFCSSSASTSFPLGNTTSPLSSVPSEYFQGSIPSYIALLGHSGSQAPQLIQSSVMIIAIVILFKDAFWRKNVQNLLQEMIRNKTWSL